MSERMQITPFQLTATLIVCRLFTVVTVYITQPEAGSFFAGTALALLLQIILAFTMMEALHFPGKVGGKLGALLSKVSESVAWLVCMAGAVMTVGLGARLTADCWYDSSMWLWITAMLGAAGIFAATRGLHALCRCAPLFALLSVGAVGALLVGTVSQMQLKYFPPLVFSWQGTWRTALLSTTGNLELVLLPLLLGRCTKKLRRRAVVFWLVLSAVVACLTAVAVILTLGGYAGGRRYPLYELARSSVTLGSGLDALLMGIWILPALLRFGVYVASISYAPRRPLWQGTAAVLLSLLMFTGCGSSSVADKSIVTMLELERSGTGVMLRLEYLDLSGGKEEQKYLVCESSCNGIADGLAQLSQHYSRSFYLGGCGMLTLAGDWDAQSADSWLTDLDSLHDLRPMTPLLLTEQAMLQVGGDEKQSAAVALRMLFASKGGGVPDSSSLKDTIAALRDERLSLELPVAEKRDAQTVVAEWRKLK